MLYKNFSAIKVVNQQGIFMRKYIDVPNKSVRDQIVSILGKGNITFDRNSMPECNYIEESNYPKIRHLIDVPSLEKATSYKGNPEAEFKAFLETHNVFINGYPIMNGKNILSLQRIKFGDNIVAILMENRMDGLEILLQMNFISVTSLEK